MMDNFLINVEFDESANSFTANFANGEMVRLDAHNYHDAVLEADLLTEVDIMEM